MKHAPHKKEKKRLSMAGLLGSIRVDPQGLRLAYTAVFHEVQRGKLLERYTFLGGSYLCLVDGTELFNSEKIHCKNCCRKEHRDGRVTYHHQMLGAVKFRRLPVAYSRLR